MTFLAQIRAVCRKHPNLGVDGFMSIPQSPDYRKTVATNRQDLLDRANDINFVVNWLDGVEKTKLISRKCGSSYSLKHSAEPESPNRYLANGVFIAGAIIAGFDFIRSHDGNGKNAYFNMSCRSIARKFGKSLPFETGYSAVSLVKEI